MTRAITMKEVAKRAGVSPMTVSRAFRQDASVSAETRRNILKAADELGYVFDSTASNLRSQKTGFVAVTIPSLNNSNFADTVTAISDDLAEHGLQPLLGYTNYCVEKEEALIEQFLRRKPEAIVVTGGQHTHRGRQLLEKARIPVIEMWDQPRNPVAYSVGFSNARAMHELTDKLVRLGHHALGFIGGGPQSDTRAQDRRNGYIRAVSGHGLDASRLIDTTSTNFSIKEAHRAFQELTSRFPEVKTVICASDLYAFGVLSACQRTGIKVPNDLAIAGFGAFEIASFTCPTLTTVDAKPSEIGQKTASLIAALLAGEAAQEVPINHETRYELLIRESTSGCV